MAVDFNRTLREARVMNTTAHPPKPRQRDRSADPQESEIARGGEDIELGYSSWFLPEQETPGTQRFTDSMLRLMLPALR